MKGCQVKPGFVLAHFYLGLAYLDLKDKDGVRREYEALKPLDGDYARDLLGLIQTAANRSVSSVFERFDPVVELFLLGTDLHFLRLF